MLSRWLPIRLIGSWTSGLSLALLLGLGAGQIHAQDLASAARSARRALPSVMIQSPSLRCRISADASFFDVLDKPSKAMWESGSLRQRLGTITLRVNGREETRDLENGRVNRESPSSAVAIYLPLPDQPAAAFKVTFSVARESHSLDLSWQADPSLEVVSVRLLDDALSVASTEQGYAVIPIREGLMVPADSGLAFTNAFATYAYEGCHMAMAGLVKNGAAAMILWDDPNASFILKSIPGDKTSAKPQRLFSSVELRGGRGLQLQFLGYGDYLTIGNAYRDIARRNEWLVTWDDKLRQHPADSQLFGAINFKLWSVLERQMNAASDREISVKTNWTFAEAAQVAEHLKHDLRLEHVLFTLGGWIHRGYDNQHPDILPAAPECGGTEGLAACARRVKDLGYLFCLHDNYQDIYRDSPSWNESLVMRRHDGKLAEGGDWAGGHAYLVCSRKGLELAQRTQNLAAVKQLINPSAYFIDTTYAAGLQECFDTNHPLSRSDDLRYKAALSDYARELFGMFGSECGREWAVPHADFFEGYTGVSGRWYHDEKLPAKFGGVVVPLFEIAFHDTIAAYGKYGYDIHRSAEYVLTQMLLGRTLNYHDVPAHLYWQRKEGKWEENPMPAPGTPNPAAFVRGDSGWAAGMHPFDRFVKNTYEAMSPLNELAAQLRVTGHSFLTPDRKVQQSVFGVKRKKITVTINTGATNYTCNSLAGGAVGLPPFGFLIESLDFVAFHALSWRGLQYPAPVLFTLRSLDNQPLARSGKVRVYHGFGNPRIVMPKGEVTVAREEIITGPAPDGP